VVLGAVGRVAACLIAAAEEGFFEDFFDADLLMGVAAARLGRICFAVVRKLFTEDVFATVDFLEFLATAFFISISLC